LWAELRIAGFQGSRILGFCGGDATDDAEQGEGKAG
jgi:hypothetical protein